MTKICTNCKTENPDNAEFCQECGTELNEPANTMKSDKKSGRNKTPIAIAAVVGVCCIGLILIVVMGGFLSPNKNQTTLSNNFSSDGLTFSYPRDWTNGTPTTTIVSSGSGVSQLGTLDSTDGITLSISKADLTSMGAGATISTMKELTKQNLVNGSSIQVLSDNQTTVNGVNVYEFTYNFKDPSNQDGKSIYVVTGKDSQTVYYLQFIGEPTTIDQNKDLISQIIGTIKIQ